MLHGTQYCSKCLIWSFPKAKLPLRQFALLVLMSFLPSLPPSGLPRGPCGFAFGMPSKMFFRHLSFHSSPRQTTALQEIPTDGTNCATPQLDPWAQSSLGRSNLGSQLICVVGLSFMLRMTLGRDSMRSLFSPSPLDILLSTSRPFFLHNFSYL